MFVKITSGQIDKYPYSVGDLRRDNPNTSFPRVIPAATMASFGMYPVGYEAAPDYDPMTHRLAVSKTPVLKGGNWVLTKTAVALTEAEIAGRAAAKANEVREQRAKLLSETDWMALSDNTLSPAWAAYRQALRDITSHANFPYLAAEDWPSKPE